MVIYVDPLFTATPRLAHVKKHGSQWCHLMSDSSVEELHDFAQSIGLKREWFQRTSIPHYDLTPAKRVQALKNGAVELSRQDASSIVRGWIRQWNGGNPTWEGDR